MTTLRIIYLAVAFFSVLGVSYGNKFMVENFQTDYIDDRNFFSAKEEENSNLKKDTDSKGNKDTSFISYSNDFKDDFLLKNILSRSRIKRSQFNDQFNKSLDDLLKSWSESLTNNSTVNNIVVLNDSNFVVNIHEDEDRCQMWLDKREQIEAIFPGSINNLPSCPCRYPNDIVYENMLWDKKRRMRFRWRDASSDSQRLKVYKPGAAYCLRSFPSATSTAAQHCCYDKNRKLLTRGSGAGTPYVVSPDISNLLHDKIDLTPWRLCKGDFTRYNKVRVPNNGNNCKRNPKEEEYQLQVQEAQDF